MADETIVDETTTSETIKYSKTETFKNESDEEETKTTNVFENFEPWHYGEPAIPTELYFLGADGDGYQQYFDNNGYGFIQINAVDSKGQQLFEINGKPIRGCKKGSVVKANKLASGQYDTKIWLNADGEVCYQDFGYNTKKLDTGGVKLTRLGIALVGGGGASGGAKTENWKNNCCNFDTTMPGGGGGGGAILWGIINLEQSNDLNKYIIKFGSGGNEAGDSGKNTILSHEGFGELAIAGGGEGGDRGSRSGATGGNGGSCWVTNNKNYFILCGYCDGASLNGGSYNEVNENGDSDSKYIESIVSSNEFKISFVPNSGEVTCGSGQHTWVSTSIADISEKEGKVYLAVPGGNSYGNGGYQQIDGALIPPTWGGGGMCWTYNGNEWHGDECEHIWANNANKFKEKSTQARCGAKGGWILFY